MSEEVKKDNTGTAIRPRRYARWRTPAKVVAWTLMGIVLFVVGLIAATLTILRPERLTPIVTAIAGNNLNADVSIGRVELSMAPGLPYLNLDVDRMVVISRDIRALDAETREMIPGYADTLMTVSSISGGVNLTALLANRVELRDITIASPRLNLVVVDDSTTNFNIFQPSEDTTAVDFASLPEFVINRFEITDPGPVRYFDCESGTQFQADFRSIALVGKDAPMYTLDFTGNVEAPLLMEYFHFDDLRFGLRGNIRWSQQKPYAIGLDNFDFKLSFLEGVISTDVNFTDHLVVDKLDLRLKPIDIYQVIHILPDEMAEALSEDFNLPFSLYTDLETDMKLEISARLLKPFNAATDGIPAMEASVLIPESRLRWDKLDLTSLKASLLLTVPDENLDNATLDVRYLDMSGPATDLKIKGVFRNLLTNPVFEADVSARTDISRLPSQLRQLFGGKVAGLVHANAHIEGAASMFSPSGFQHLLVEGDVGVKNFYWLAYDTVNMVKVDRALFKFGTQKRVRTAGGLSAPLLSASVEADSLTVLSGNDIMAFRDIRLGLATRNGRRADRMAVQPMGGGLSIGAFNFLAFSDTAVVRLRDIRGGAVIRPIDGNLHRPEFIFRLSLGRLSAGDNSTRLMVRDAELDFSARRKPETERQKRVRRSADSLMRRIAGLTPDSAIAIAESMHRRPSHRKYPRVHPQEIDSLSEVIDFGTSTFLRRVLTRWTLEGSLTSGRAGMFTPYFPLRNRFSHIDIAFNNDTLKMNNIEYKAGRSDITFSGEVTNLRRALTSRRHRIPLKIRFQSVSDTIDVNQLANSAFAGSAYADSRISHFSLDDNADENELDSIIGMHVADAPDNMAPLLIPRNIDLELICRAENLIYSDLLLKHMTGSLLAYDGALNLNRLRAASDVGDLNMSALYMGSSVDSLSFAFGMKLDRFNLNRFLKLVPAVDSMMPVLRDFSGLISADLAFTTPIDRNMDLNLNRLNAAIRLDGKDLVLIDPATFKSLSKWLLFKDKNRNVIDSMSVQMSVENGLMQVYPFIFNIDRYRLGVQGHNDLNMNFDYHIAVLKSPIPFRFGINVKGNPDKFKVRLGGAKFNDKTAMKQVAFVDTTRVNLIRQIQNVFRRGVRGASMQSLQLDRSPAAASINLSEGELSAADSLELYRQGMIPEPPASLLGNNQDNKNKKKNSNRQRNRKGRRSDRNAAIKPKE